jgi:hypothetical protein
MATAHLEMLRRRRKVERAWSRGLVPRGLRYSGDTVENNDARGLGCSGDSGE